MPRSAIHCQSIDLVIEKRIDDGFITKKPKKDSTLHKFPFANRIWEFHFYKIWTGSYEKPIFKQSLKNMGERNSIKLSKNESNIRKSPIRLNIFWS